MSTATRAYFSRVYPRRTGLLSRLLCRHGEGERLQLVRQWLPACDGLRILDAGCGDGVFLGRLLHGRPACIRLEDLVAARVHEAHARLRGRADTIEAQVTDVAAAQDAARYDIVLALGIFDYNADWPALLRRLLARTAGRLVADFPKRGTLHDHLRRIWLRRHAIILQSTTRQELEELLQARSGGARIAELTLNWMADIRPGPG